MFAEPFYVVCHNIRSLHNVGAIFRTADAAGMQKVFLGGYTGCPPREKMHKTALGAEQWTPWEHERQTWRTLERLRDDGIRILALENNVAFRMESVETFRPKFPAALVLGNEVQGLSPAMLRRADHVLHIPMYGHKSSLNVAVAFGIAAYTLNRRRR